MARAMAAPMAATKMTVFQIIPVKWPPIALASCFPAIPIKTVRAALIACSACALLVAMKRHHCVKMMKHVTFSALQGIPVPTMHRVSTPHRG